MQDRCAPKICTRFDVATLAAIFGTIYVITTLVFGPTQLGWPANRLRRFTVMIHRDRCIVPRELSIALFSSLFFRQCGVSGHIFFCASSEALEMFWNEQANDQHLDNRGSMSARDLLKQGALQRLLGYERLCIRIHGNRKGSLRTVWKYGFCKSCGSASATDKALSK